MRQLVMLTLMSFVAAGCASSQFYRDPAFDKAPKKVTLLMVAGPEKMLKTGKDVPQQENLDLLQKKLVEGLKGAGFTLVDIGSSAAAVKNFDAAFAKVMAANTPADVAALKKEGEAKFTTEFGADPKETKLVTAAGTVYLIDYQTPGLGKDKQAQYSETFRKASGEIAASVKSDLYAVARHRVVQLSPAFAIPGTGGEQIQTIVDFALFGADGTLLFSENVSWTGSQTATINGMHLPMSNSKIKEDSRDGIDKAVASIVKHMTAK